MPEVIPPTGEGGAAEAGDGRSEWIRPALHHLNVSDAENKQTEADDGVQGKGIKS